MKGSSFQTSGRTLVTGLTYREGMFCRIATLSSCHHYLSPHQWSPDPAVLKSVGNCPLDTENFLLHLVYDQIVLIFANVMSLFILCREILPLGRGRQRKILLKSTLCCTLFIRLQAYSKRNLSHVWLSTGNTTSAKQISYSGVLVHSCPLYLLVYFVWVGFHGYFYCREGRIHPPQNCTGPHNVLPLLFCPSRDMQGQPNTREIGKSTASNQKQPSLFITAYYIQYHHSETIYLVCIGKNWKNAHYLLKDLVTFFYTLLFTLCLNKLGYSQWNPQNITSCNMHVLFTTCKKFP